MKQLAWLYILVLATAWGCERNIMVEADYISKDYLNVASEMDLQGEGQERELAIEANCIWNVTVPDRWLTVTPTVGYGSRSLTIVADRNDAGVDRTTVLAISGGSAPVRHVVVKQYKSAEVIIVEKTMTLSTTILAFEAEESSQSFTISSNTGWTIACPDWCALSVASGSGNATITITASENTKTEQRTGTITVIGDGVPTATIQLTQKGKAGGTQIEPGEDDNLPPT